MLTEDQIDELILDPTKIETREQAVEALDTLDREIAGITAQIDTGAIDATREPLGHDRQ